MSEFAIPEAFLVGMLIGMWSVILIQRAMRQRAAPGGIY